MPDPTLDGRVVIVTGAASGLGKEYAMHLAQAGARLVLADVATSDPPAGSALEKLRVRMVADGAEVVTHCGDIGDENTADELVDLAVREFGHIDVLINNAGNWYEGELIDSDIEAWDSIMRTHLRGHFLTTRAAGRYWRSCHRLGESVNAAIVNTSSRSALNAIPTHGVYGAAKAGVATLTQVAAKELEPFGVRVNCVVPAARTPMAARVTAMKTRLSAELEESTFDPLAPANVAPLVTYLSSVDCPLTGQMLFCRGGRIELYAPWTSYSTLERGGPWTVSELSSCLPEHIQAREGRVG